MVEDNIFKFFSETMDMETILDLTPSTDEILDLRKPKYSDSQKFSDSSPVMDKISSSSVAIYPDRTPLYYTPVSQTSPHLHPAIRDSQQNMYTPNMYTPDLVTSTYSPLGHNIITPSVRCEKPTRPFKAYPSDPLPFVVSSSTPDVMIGLDSNEEFLEFRRRMLSKIQPPPTKQNKNMNRSSSPNISTTINEDDPKRAAYLEKRRKNNEAAKRSRDARRAKEDEIAIRAAFLEQENLRLKYELATLKDETEKLRTLVYNRHK